MRASCLVPFPMYRFLTPFPSFVSCRQCPTCPDPANCARLLEEKWRQAYNAVFRFGSCPSLYGRPSRLFHSHPLGPCQPSMVYRYLRNLEGVSPPLSLTHLACQTTAKAFTATRERCTFIQFSPDR